jgi:hypothetical protein
VLLALILDLVVRSLLEVLHVLVQFDVNDVKVGEVIAREPADGVSVKRKREHEHELGHGECAILLGSTGVRGAKPVKKRWRRGKSISLTPSLRRSELR